MPTSDEELLRDIESLKNMMVARATGSFPSESEYRQLRARVIRHPVASKLLPRFVHTCRTVNEFWCHIKPKYDTYAARRNYLTEQFDPVLSRLEQAARMPADITTDEVLRRVDSATVHEVWQRALDRRATDPEGAITLARTLLEATCKHILESGEVDYDNKADLPKLYSLVAGTLNLAPKQHVEPIFKQILGGCHSVVQGLGSLRSKLGDAHAQGSSHVRPATRHAELAVNLAGAMATFLIATWEAREE